VQDSSSKSRLAFPPSLAPVKLAAIYGVASLLVLQAARSAYYFSVHERFADTAFSAVVKSWMLGLRFDLTAIAMFVGLPIILLALPRPQQIAKAWLWIWHVAACIGLCALVFASIADFYFLGEVQRHMGQEVMTVANDLDFVGAFAVGPAKWGLMVLIALLVAIAIACRFLHGRSQTQGSWLQFMILLIAGGIAGRGSLGDKPINAIDAFDAGSYELTQLQLNGAFSIAKAMGREGPQVSQSDIDSALAQLGHANDDPFARRSKPGPTRNVVVFLLESWSSVYVDAFSDKPLGVTPNMDAMARDGLAFTQFFAAGQRSYEGVQATLTGLPALPGVPTLTEGLTLRTSRIGAIASDHGMRTIFSQASKRRSLRLDSVANALGFAEYYGREDIKRFLLDYPDVNAFRFGIDHETMQTLADNLRGETKPFMAFLFTGTTHAPLAPLPESVKSHYPVDHPDKAFLDAVHYADWSIGQFMERARKEPWFENTVFIFAADHTRGLDAEMRDRFRIPMVIYAPKIFAPRVDTRIASQVDIFDTVIELIGAETSYASFGRSLLQPPSQNRALIRSGENMGVVTPKRCFMYTGNELPADADAMYLANYRSVLYGVIQRNNWLRNPSLN
jgi:phosphoglycerol transferase MdoB-like AlkP superfamily enzyme